MRLKIAICDDDKDDVDIIQSYLHNYEMKNDIDFDVYTFTNSKTFLSAYTHPGSFHVIFLDVEMPDKNGLEIAEYIRNIINDSVTKIVFVSNYPEYMQDSFNVQAFHYFPKPFLRNNFINVMTRILTDLEKNNITKLLIREDNIEELVYLNDIIMVSTKDAAKKRITITLVTHEICATGRVTECEKDLSAYGFVSPSRGFLVNLYHVHYLKGTEIILDNGISLPLSRRNKKEVMKRFNNRLLFLTGNR